jgi:hypothetical protein
MSSLAPFELALADTTPVAWRHVRSTVPGRYALIESGLCHRGKLRCGLAGLRCCFGKPGLVALADAPPIAWCDVGFGVQSRYALIESGLCHRGQLRCALDKLPCLYREPDRRLCVGGRRRESGVLKGKCRSAGHRQYQQHRRQPTCQHRGKGRNGLALHEQTFLTEHPGRGRQFPASLIRAACDPAQSWAS